MTFAFRGDLIAERMAPAVAKGGVLSQSWSLSRLTCEAGAFEIEGDLVRTMYVVRNPDKLKHLAPA